MHRKRCVTTVHYEAVCGSSVVLHFFAFSFRFVSPFRLASGGRCDCGAKGTDQRRNRCRPTGFARRVGAPGPFCLLNSSRGGFLRPVSDLVDYSSCRRLFSLPSSGFSCASSQEFFQQGRAAHSFDRSRGSDPYFKLHAAPKPNRKVKSYSRPKLSLLFRRPRRCRAAG
jgi:hypothetical protein